MLANEVRATTIPLPGNSEVAMGFRAGQFIRTNVEAEGGNLFMMLGPHRVPLPQDSGLQAGQWISVEIARGEDGAQLRVTPEGRATTQSGAAPAAGTALPAAANVLGEVLVQLGAFNAGGTAQQLLAPQLPNTPAAIRALLSLFLSRSNLGDNLAQVNVLVQGASREGVLSHGFATTFAALAGQWAVTESRDFRVMLERLGDGRPWEARLAELLQKGQGDATLEDLGRSLRLDLERLRGDAKFRAFLEAHGELRAFDEAAQRVQDRLTGSYLQNLRSSDLPYFFAELPLQPESGIRHAQVHLFHEGTPAGRHFDEKNVTMFLDLSLTRLGDLWVTVRVLGGQCQCRIQASNEAAVNAISAAADELSAGLAEAGFPGAQVAAVPWDGDRLREVVSLMERFQGLNLTA